MKKYCLIILLSCISLQLMSNDYYVKPNTPYGIYGVEQNFDVKLYNKNYLNKPLTFLPCKYEREINSFLGLSRSDEGKKYLITKFGAKDNRETDMDLIIHFREENDNAITKRNLKVISGTYSVLDLPFIDEEKVGNEMKESIGVTYTNPDAKNVYKIVDAKFEYFDESSEYKSIVYYIFDNISGDTFRLSDMTKSHDNLSKLFFDKKIMMIFDSAENSTHPQSNSYIGTEIKENMLSMAYKDSLLDINLFPLRTSFGVILKNKSKNTMKIIWDDAVFVNTEGISDNVIHSGVKFIEKEKSQVPSTIIRGATFRDKFTSQSSINWINSTNRFTWKFGVGFTNEHTPGRWSENKIYPDLDEVPEYHPLFMHIMIPIQIKDEINEYIFDIKYFNSFYFPYTKECR